MAYVELDDLEAVFLRSTITADTPEIEAALFAAEAMVDHYCGRTFIVPTAASTRRFTPVSQGLVKVDDIAGTTDLVIVDNGATLASSMYQLETSPGRSTQVGADGVIRPWCYIRRISSAWFVPHTGESTLVITARYGWPAVPAAVVQATKLLTKDLVEARDTRFGVAQLGEFSRRITENAMVSQLLQPYRAAESWGVA
jgi:hypothetical protein